MYNKCTCNFKTLDKKTTITSVLNVPVKPTAI